MPIHGEPDLPDRTQSSSEESTVRRAPVEHEDAYELQDHEFTLEPEEPTIESRMPLDERTAPWSTMPPLPAWAATARELLEPAAVQARNDALFYDDQPTPAGDAVDCSLSALLALREELAHATHEHQRRIERLERALAETRDSAAAIEARLRRHNAELIGQVRGQAFLIADLRQSAQARLPPEAEIPIALPASSQADDLRRIRGLGKRFVERLGEIGVQQFAQIASWTPADVERIAAQLGVRPKRIQREGWIKQAHKLAEGSGGPARRARKTKPASAVRKRKAGARRRSAR
jgi:predicted flap endonuclease-1-like 5' DNA nuclease